MTEQLPGVRAVCALGAISRGGGDWHGDGVGRAAGRVAVGGVGILYRMTLTSLR